MVAHNGQADDFDKIKAGVVFDDIKKLLFLHIPQVEFLADGPGHDMKKSFFIF
jgi:hypothetical protein